MLNIALSVLAILYLLNGLILAMRVNAVGDKPMNAPQAAAWVVLWPLMIWLECFK